jgi:hypothetical protein
MAPMQRATSLPASAFGFKIPGEPTVEQCEGKNKMVRQGEKQAWQVVELK